MDGWIDRYLCVCVFGAMWKMGKGTPGNKWSKTSSDSLLPVSFTTLLTLILNDLNGSS